MNLVGNAVKFTERGEVVLVRRRVDARTRPTRWSLPRFEVRDTGIGIDAERAAAPVPAVHPGRQLDDAAVRRHRPGLAISKRLAELMGGEIGVESRPAQGSTFWFTVRLARTEATAPPLFPDILDGVRALLLVGNGTLRSALQLQLGGWGIEANAVDSWTLALERLSHGFDDGRPYDVVLFDDERRSPAGRLHARPGRRPGPGRTPLVVLTMHGRTGAMRLPDRPSTVVISRPIRGSASCSRRWRARSVGSAWPSRACCASRRRPVGRR